MHDANESPEECIPSNGIRKAKINTQLILGATSLLPLSEAIFWGELSRYGKASLACMILAGLATLVLDMADPSNYTNS